MPTPSSPDDLLSGLTSPVRGEPESGIMMAVNHGWRRQGVIPLWAGEGSLPTPAFICEGAKRSLDAGETFYTWQRGIPDLRQALATYYGRVYRKEISFENFFVTCGGMHAIQMAIQLVTGEGDEILIPTPAWPNFAGSLRLKGAVPVEVPMSYAADGWSLDLDRLFDAATPRTRAIIINSPSNPLGWVASLDDIVAVRDFARSRGLWIIADEVYGRYCYIDGIDGRAPSFLDVCEVEERLLLPNTFSKNWAMTGWRTGWLLAPQALGGAIENLVQYNTSGVPGFLQRGCIRALEEGEDFLHQQLAQARDGLTIVTAALDRIDGIDYAPPSGAFYLFFRIAGVTDSMAMAKRLIDDAGVGLAPGIAFGRAGEGFMRLCFLRQREHLTEAMRRLAAWFTENR